MPRLLLITFHYPPRPTIGSLRPGALAKHLPRFGWEVVVVTPKVQHGSRPPGRVIETPYEDALERLKKKIPGLDPRRGLQAQLKLPQASKPQERHFLSATISLLRSLLTYPEDEKGWRGFALDAIEKIDFPVDAILSTAPPITTHIVAQAAKLKLKCPWIADFRDLWATNLDNLHHPILHFWDRRLEKKYLHPADALVTVSRPWADRLQQSYPGKPVHVVSNGFDPDDFTGTEELDQHFSICYTGQLYSGRRDPTSLFEAVHELIEQGVMAREKVRIHLYGPIEPWVLPLIERYDLGGVVELHGSINRSEALRRQQQSQILLLLGWANPRETGQHTGKLFEYLGSRRPILAVGGVAGVLTETLEETRAGIHALSKHQLRQYLIESYAEFEERGEVSFRGDESKIMKYTHETMARNFSTLLEAHCGRSAVTLPADSETVLSGIGNHSGV
jgi:glycosyltransferase involved in cell wall biosynthesis